VPENVENRDPERRLLRKGHNRVRKRISIFVTVVALLALADSAEAGSIGDFFKALGNSIAHPSQKKAKPRETKTASKRSKTKGPPQEGDYPPEPTATPVVPATPTPTIQQVPVRVASLPAQTKRSKRDIPYAIPVPNKPGLVTSPYAPKQGLVDVRGFPSGTEVTDPYTGKVFLTP
jgi:hypothetical protein